LVALFWIPFLVIPFFFLIVLPQRRQARAADVMQGRLVEGDEIIMTSGIFGTIVRLDDATLDLKIAPSVVITIDRRAVGRIAADLSLTAPPGEES
jgi:preprotein translocase subunit YajC